MTEIIGRRKISTDLLKKENKKFYKLVDHNMMGNKDYKYEVGKVFEVDYNKDELHFCDNIFSTFRYGNGEYKSIILEVEPLSNECYCDEHHEYTCDKLKVIRILDDKEILNALDSRPRSCLSNYYSPIICHYFTYEYLIKYKDKINRNLKALKIIYESKELTDIQKKEIIKKSKLKLL